MISLQFADKTSSTLRRVAPCIVKRTISYPRSAIEVPFAKYSISMNRYIAVLSWQPSNDRLIRRGKSYGGDTTTIQAAVGM